ncbi:hypothetical protein ABZ714_03640 [Streptomyces sp. NPDC006798]|uniref:hypothetical protein n=1 Tax=Streptomyces sp. NPDC006798 TaxID=3155462 RepID=UPI0033E6A1A5
MTVRGTAETTMTHRQAAAGTSSAANPHPSGSPENAGDFAAPLRVVAELDTPDGYKAELARGKIVVSP